VKKNFNKDYLFDKKKWDACSEFPLHLDLELNTSCNLACLMCPREKDSSEDMPLNVAKKIIKYCSENGTLTIKPFWRGEGTLYPHIEEILKYAKDCGLQVMINSNGSFKHGLSCAKYIDWLSISVDKYHGNVNKEMFKKVKELKKMTYVEIQTCDKDNKEIAEFCFNNKIKLNHNPIVKRNIKNEYEYISYENNEIKQCTHPFWRILIGSDLYARYCCIRWDDSARLSKIDINNLDCIKEIWNNNTYYNIRKQHLDKKIIEKDCINCKHCHVV